MAATATAASTSAIPEITILKRHREDLPLAQNKFLKKTAKGKVLQCESYSACQFGRHTC
jgi:exosome complex exonuclease DIS3/RRP44